MNEGLNLNNLGPAPLLILGVIWILREVFGFLRKSKSSIVSVNEMDLKALMDTLERVGDNIEAQTKLVVELTYEMRSVRDEVRRLETDLTGLKEHMFRRKN